MIKRAVERTLHSSGLLRVLRSFRCRDALVLAYHNIVPAGDPIRGDASLHLSLDDFRAQLELLTRSCDVVPLAALLAPAPHRARRPRVAITFDDAYHGAVSLGLPELTQRGLPSTVFVAPGLLEGETFWWDALAGAGEDWDAIRATALSRGRGLGAEVGAWAAEAGAPWTVMSGSRVSSSWQSLARQLPSTDVTLASHTWSHPNLTRLRGEDLQEELRRPLAWLAAQNVPWQPWISWPYGLADDTVRDLARQVGYQAAFRVDGGWMSNAAGPFDLPRWNVPAGISIDGFAMRLAGLLAA